MHFAQWQDLLHREALKESAFTGWSDASLAHACQKLGRSPSDIRLAFPDGVRDWIIYFFAQIDRQMEERAPSLPLASMKIRERIAQLVWLRFSLLPTNKEIMRRLMTTLATPSFFTYASSRLWQTADQIWRLAGDDAADFNHYSKRTLLGSVYSSTMMCWLQDQSEGNRETWEFLHRRIEEILKAAMMLKGA